MDTTTFRIPDVVDIITFPVVFDEQEGGFVLADAGTGAEIKTADTGEDIKVNQ